MIKYKSVLYLLYYFGSKQEISHVLRMYHEVNGKCISNTLFYII